MSIAIGTYVARAQTRPWHYVESVIENRAVTRCGRELVQDAEHPLYVRESLLVRVPLRPCKQCGGGFQ